MAFRRRWITVVALTPFTLFIAASTGETFPFVVDAFALRCSGSGDQSQCPDQVEYLAGVMYSATLVAIAAMIIGVVFVILATKAHQRRLLANDLQLLTLAAAWVQLLVSTRIALTVGGPYLLSGLLQVLAMVLLVRALSRTSRSLGVVSCLVGIASAFGPLTSPVLGAVQAGTAGCFAILLVALVVRWAPIAPSGVGQ